MMMMTKKNKIFYDTNALLLMGEEIFNKPDVETYISSVSLEELEHIKTSANKDPEVKYAARHIARLLDEHYLQYHIVVYSEKMAINGAEMSPDMKIIACARSLKDPDLYFVSNDICCKHLARLYFRNVISVEEKDEEYSGYKDICPTEEELSQFYADNTKNIFELNIGEYLILRDANDQIIDLRCWDGLKYRYLKYNTFDSVHFGRISPYKNDLYQKMAFDSLQTNTITMLRGPAGSGKSVISLAYLFNLLEHGTIDKIVIFCNPVAVKGAAKLGFYPGEKNVKLLDSQIGNILISKLGAREEVERLINEEKIVLVPMSDARGINISSNCAVYATEAQNMDKSLIKLLLQRAEDDVKIIIDGDYTTQLDMSEYEGMNNGMRALSQAFRGSDLYGEIELRKIYRGRVAELAENI